MIIGLSCLWNSIIRNRLDFFDKLKSSTKGYASFDCMSGYRVSKLVKMDILLNSEKVDALSFIVQSGLLPRARESHRGKSGRQLIPSLNNLKYQSKRSIGHQKIVGSLRYQSLRKNVLAMLWRGHLPKTQTLEKQKKGKAHEANRLRGKFTGSLLRLFWKWTRMNPRRNKGLFENESSKCFVFHICHDLPIYVDSIA